jgi:hypothetical protein
VKASQIITSTKKYTLRGISSLLNLDAFSAKRKKLLHQRLQGTSHRRILNSRTRRIEYKQHHSCCQKQKRADKPQEKQSPLLPFSDVFEEGADALFLGGTRDGLVTKKKGLPLESSRKTKGGNYKQHPSLARRLHYRRNHSTSRRRERVKGRKIRKAKCNKLTSPVTRTYQAQGPWQ